jgi:hypothetical protein
MWMRNGAEISEDDIRDIVAEEYTEDDYEEQLTEEYGTVYVGSCIFDAGAVVRALAETTFRCGLVEERNRIADEIIRDEGGDYGIEWVEDEEDEEE